MTMTAPETADGAPGTIAAVLKDRIRVATGNGALDVLTLQPPGKKAMNAADWARLAFRSLNRGLRAASFEVSVDFRDE